MALSDTLAKVSSHKGYVIGGFGVLGVGAWLWGKHRAKKAAAASTSATGIDPATGYPTGSASDLAALQVLDNQPGTSAYPSSALFGTPGGTGAGSGGGGGGGGKTPGSRGGGGQTLPNLGILPGGMPAPSPVNPTVPSAPLTAIPTAQPTPIPSSPQPVTPAIPAATSSSTPPVSIPGTPNAGPGTGSAGVATAKAAGAPFGYTTIFSGSGGQTYYGLGNPTELAAAKAAGYTITTAKAAGVPGGSTTAKYAYLP